MTMPKFETRWGAAIRNIVGAAIAVVLTTSPGAVLAEDFNIAPLSPIMIQEDVAGLNLATGKIAPEFPVLSIPAAPRLRFERIQNAAPFIKGEEKKSYLDGEPVEGDWTVHTADGMSEAFHCDFFTPEGDFGYCYNKHSSGSALTKSGRYYTQKGTGARYYFGATHLHTTPARDDPYPKWLRYYYATSIIYPDGEVISYEYDSAQLPGDEYGRTWRRPIRISTNLGYYISITYHGDVLGEPEWGMPQTVSIFSEADPETPLVQMTYTVNGVATDLLSRVYQGITDNSMGVPTEDTSFSITLPGETAAAVAVVDQTYSYTNNGLTYAGTVVKSITRDGVRYSYNFANPQYVSDLVGLTYDSVTVTGPAGYSAQYEVKLEGNRETIGMANRIKSATDPNGRTTSYQYDDLTGRLIGMIAPEGNSISIDYDAAGNIEKKTSTPKPGSGLASVSEQSFVDLSGVPMIEGQLQCDDLVMCWRPQWVRDAKGNQTDLEYNSRGQLTARIDPADSDGIRRKTIIEYTTATTGISRKSVVRICGVGTTCGTDQEHRTEYTYWGNTALPSSVRQVDPATGTYLETTFTYDEAGRMKSQDGPLPGTDDAVYYRYDPVGRRTWEIGPKGEIGPNGENGLRPATRTTYRDADDQVEKVEKGRLLADYDPASLTDPAFELFMSVNTDYNAERLPRKVRVIAGGVAETLTHISYDARNREICKAVRMNAEDFESTTNDACALQTGGANGPDRIARTWYDDASQVTRITQAYGTSLERDYATYTYSDNGKMASMTDARGFRAEMRYDGFDRQIAWVFPSKTATGTVASCNIGAITEINGISGPADARGASDDCEKYSYDRNGNRAKLVKRDGSVLGFEYDALNRMTKKTVEDRAGLDAEHTRDVFYRYDLRDLQLGAAFDSSWGEGVRTTYDVYGRPTRSTYYDGTLYRQLDATYDAAGNRLSLEHPDGETFFYEYTTGGQFDRALDAAGRILFDFRYNDRNELASMERTGLAPDPAYTYDTLGRLETLGWDNAGSNSVAWSFTRNPAGQILTETQSNDLYRWTGHADLDRSYTANGLNQYIEVDGAGYCHDANGNLTADGQYAYLYDVENRLVEMRARMGSTCPVAYTGQIKAKLRYDPLGRLYEVENFVNGVAQRPTRFLYDGDALVAEYDAAGTMLARHVHGPAAGVDDPLVTYTDDTIAVVSTRHLYADPRGSVVFVTDRTGSVTTINSYDEYGVPGAANEGRFQYTGQVWLPELGMYYYKARIYSPTLGRFLQTDPIGYADNSNLYAYVGNDPINGIDPSGKSCTRTGGASRIPTVTCKVDDLKSFKKAGLSKKQIQRLERNYTNSVNKLLRRPSRSVDIDVGGRSMTATSGEVADGLMRAFVSYRNAPRSGNFATMDGGELRKTVGRGALRRRWRPTNPRSLPFEMRIYPNFFKLDDAGQQQTIVHEGLHTVEGEKVFRGIYSDHYRNHREPYNDAADDLLGQ